MKIYMIRHADALPAGQDGITGDAERPLSDAGKVQSQALATTLQQHAVQLDAILTSPLLRARQTAEEMLRHWTGTAPEVQVADDLALDGKAKRLFRSVRDLGKEAVALVGHQPDLVAHVAWLIGSKKTQLDLAKAGVACIQCDGEMRKGAGMLLWLVTPDWYGGNGAH